MTKCLLYGAALVAAVLNGAAADETFLPEASTFADTAVRIPMRQPMRQFVDQREQFLFGAQVRPQSNLVAVNPAVNAGR